MYSDVVLGIEHHHFEEILEEHKDSNGYSLDTDLAPRTGATRHALQGARGAGAGKPFPQDPQEQLWARSARCSAPG
jgi:pyruvate,orthophosphate dikinase